MKSDHSTSPVPPDQSVGAFRIAMILMGVVIALPAFAMGAQLAHAMGAGRALLASIAGGAIIAGIAMCAAVAGAQSRLSSYMLIVRAFGHRGGAVANGVLAVSLLGWFAIIAMMFGQALRSSTEGTLPGLSVTAWSLLGAILMTATAAVGFRALDLLSLLSTPLKIILLLATFYGALTATSADVWALTGDGQTSVGTGISMVAGGLMVGAVLAPDICRFAKTPMHGAWGVFAAYGVGFPAVLILSGLPSLATGQADLVAIMVALGMGLPSLLIILLSAWVTNSYNLYASSLVLVTTFPRRSRRGLAVVAGVLGTVLGLLGVGEKMMSYLLLLSIAIPPIAGVYLSHYYLSPSPEAQPRAWHPRSLLAWLAGIGFAALAHALQWSATRIPALDSLLVSVAAYLALHALAFGSLQRRRA